MDSSRNHIIEALRFLAAAAIVVVHLPTLGWAYGSMGVDMFFIISGFVMMLSTQNGHQKFFQKRLIRIVPIYWVMTIFIFILAIIAPVLVSNTGGSFSNLIKSLTFVPFDKNGTGHFPILFVGWTLNYEMFFYLIFTVALLFNAKHKDLLTALTLFAFVVVLSFSSGFMASVYGNPIILEFVLGFALFEIMTTRRLGRLLVYGTIYSLPLLLPEFDLAHRAYKLGLPSFIIAGFALYFLKNVKIPGILVTLGGASYALYLSHPYVIQFCDKVLGLFSFDPVVNYIMTGAVFVLTLLTAILIYRLFERPVTKWLRARFV